METTSYLKALVAKLTLLCDQGVKKLLEVPATGKNGVCVCDAGHNILTTYPIQI